jgi:HlyD family secretion protein
MRVRNSALFRTGDAWSIFVVDGGRAQLRQVQVGRRGAHETEIISGLDEGQEVILFPSDRVTEGARVRSRQ